MTERFCSSLRENILKTLAKRESQMGSFYLFAFYEQCLIRFQFHISQQTEVPSGV